MNVIIEAQHLWFRTRSKCVLLVTLIYDQLNFKFFTSHAHKSNFMLSAH